MSPKVKQWVFPLAAAAGGAGLGALYALKIGCATGGCPITSNPWLTAGFGALLAYTLVKDFVVPREDETPRPKDAPSTDGQPEGVELANTPEERP